MNTALKVFLSMSCSGGLLILVLLLGKRFWKDSLSRQWQYYIWLIVVLRLLLPFGPEISLMGKAYQAAGQAISAPLPRQSPANAPGDVSAAGAERPVETESPTPPPSQRAGALPAESVWLVWLAAALGLLIRKITIYQGFVRYIRAGWTPVSDRELLDRLSAAAERAGVRKPVELCVHPMISSPLLMGFFRPCIVLPSADLPETNFQYTVLHELTHYRRLDMFYKWLVQLTVCLHWFNPLVHLMCREIARDCEFSCDEAVLARAGSGGAPDYGKTLLDAMAAVGRYREHPGAVTLSENKRLLKERLGAIMNFKKKSGPVRLLTGALTLCLILGAAFAGVYPAAAAGRPGDGSQAGEALRGKTDTGRYARMAEKSYEAGSLPLFQTAFCRLGQEAQGAWLDRIYADQDIAFMGAAVNLLDEDCPQILRLAETVYGDGDLAFFSNLAARMSAATLEKWLGKALEDGNWAFQSVLFDALDRDGECRLCYGNYRPFENNRRGFGGFCRFLYGLLGHAPLCVLPDAPDGPGDSGLDRDTGRLGCGNTLPIDGPPNFWGAALTAGSFARVNASWLAGNAVPGFLQHLPPDLPPGLGGARLKPRLACGGGSGAACRWRSWVLFG